MLLKSIMFNNFRPFIGQQKVLLTNSDKNDSNVTVLLGDNTYGKTTFVLAFIWCLYGESRFNSPESILNKKIEMSMASDSIETAYVEIEFEDNNIIYTMRRTQKFTKNSKGQLKTSSSEPELRYLENGELKKVGYYETDIQSAISSILPHNLASFFFFEGEKNNEIRKKDLGKSVKTLLGLEAFDKMRSHLYGSQASSSPYTNSVMGDYLKKQNDESGKKAQEEYEKYQDAERAFRCAEEEVIHYTQEIMNFENLMEEINNKLRQAAPSKEIQKRRDQIARDIRDCEEKLEKKSKEFLKFFSKDSVALFVTPLLETARVKLSRMKVTDKGIRGIEAKAIKELLARKECLCGCDLIEGTSAYKNVEKYIDYVPPKDVGGLIRSLIENIDEATEKNKDFVNEFENNYKEIVDLRLRINRLEAEDRELLAKIKEIGVIDTDDLEKALGDYKQKKNDANDKKEEAKDTSRAKKSEMETAEKNFNMYKSKSARAMKIQIYYKYAEAIYNWVNRNYALEEEKLRHRLDKYISEMFRQMYTGKRELHIDDNYNIVMTVNGSYVADTGGLRAIQYFSYVGGLVKLAYEVMLEREEDEKGNKLVLGEEYPLVLDAAFSHTDEIHTKNISKVLANSVNQLVLALMQKDWVYAKDGLLGKVSRMYELVKIDETEAHIKEI